MEEITHRLTKINNGTYDQSTVWWGGAFVAVCEYHIKYMNEVNGS